MLHRRLRDECDDSGGNMGSTCDDLGLSALVQRLDDELAGERRARESLQTRMNQLQDAIMSERKEREVQLRGFSAELEATMRGLIGRIDDGISVGAASMRERTDETETRLRSLIRRVDEGLSAGAAALQDTISSAGNTLCAGDKQRAESLTQMLSMRRQDSFENGKQTGTPRGCGMVACMPGAPSTVSDNLMQSWDQLRQENMRLRERRAQIRGECSLVGMKSGSPPQGSTLLATPSLAYPSTLQVPGSSLGSTLSGGGQQSVMGHGSSRGGAGSP